MKRGKKYIEAAKLIERGNLYDPAEAVALVKKSAKNRVVVSLARFRQFSRIICLLPPEF